MEHPGSSLQGPVAKVPPGSWQVTACPPASHQLCAPQAGGPCPGAGALRGLPPRTTAWRRARPVGLGGTYLSSLLGFAEIPTPTLRPHSETCLLIPRGEPAGPLWPLLSNPHTPVPRVCQLYPHSRPFPVLSKLSLLQRRRHLTLQESKADAIKPKLLRRKHNNPFASS